jgi:hypothetical protein
MKVFIPITDEMIEQGLIPDELVAYQPGLPLGSPLQSDQAVAQSSRSVKLAPGPTPNSAALPALSSSTYIAAPTLG